MKDFVRANAPILILISMLGLLFLVCKWVDYNKLRDPKLCENGSHLWSTWSTSALSMGQQMRFCERCNLRQDKQEYLKEKAEHEKALPK